MLDIALGHSLYSGGDYVGAESVYREAVRSDPADCRAIFGLGLACRALNKLDDAVICFSRVVELEPGNAVAYCNLGIILGHLCRLDEAEAALRKSIIIDQGLGIAHNVLGLVLFCRGDDIGAEASFRRAIELCPDDHVWRGNLGICLKRQGDISRGGEDYEWMFRADGPLGYHQAYSYPLWDGSPLDGRTILIHDHQGIGDMIQYIRFVSMPALSGGRVIVECQRQLMKLIATCNGVDSVMARDDSLPQFDVHAPLFSLLRSCGTSIDTIPSHVPYLSPDPDHFAHWRRRLDDVSRGFRVGIHWQGDPRNAQDCDRSFPMACFAPLVLIPGVTLVSLQKGCGIEQLQDRSFPVVDFGDEVDPGLETFDDTPALIANMDLVVTADTCVAHTAGALGIPVWIALPYSPDWRWFRDRTDSPWYPTARLFRQRDPGNWSGVFEQIAYELSGMMGGY